MDRKHCPRNYTVKGKESLEKKKELKSLRISEEIKLQKFYLYTFVTLTDGYNFWEHLVWTTLHVHHGSEVPSIAIDILI